MNTTHQPTQTSVLRKLNDRHRLAAAVIDLYLESGIFAHSGPGRDEQVWQKATSELCRRVSGAYLLPARNMNAGRERLLSRTLEDSRELRVRFVAPPIKITSNLMKRVETDLKTDIDQIRRISDDAVDQRLDFGRLYAWRMAILAAVHCLTGYASPVGGEDDHVAARSLVVPFTSTVLDWRTLASLHFVSQAVQQILADEILHVAQTVIAEDESWETVLAILDRAGVPLTLATAVLRGRDRLPLAA